MIRNEKKYEEIKEKCEERTKEQAKEGRENDVNNATEMSAVTKVIYE